MSSLGFVVLYLLRGPGSGDCVTANMLLQRFATAEQCRERLPEVEAPILHAAPGKGFAPVCRDLDDLCKESVVDLDYDRGVRGGVSLLWSASTGE
jgi:hypothetical protein